MRIHQLPFLNTFGAKLLCFHNKRILILLIGMIYFSASTLFADGWESSLWKDKTYRNQRVSSADPTNGNDDFIKIPKKKTVTIAEIKTRGVIKHIWMTFASKDPMARKNVVIRMYWDNHPHPSVEVPLGEFFGQGWGEEYMMFLTQLGHQKKSLCILISDIHESLILLVGLVELICIAFGWNPPFVLKKISYSYSSMDMQIP
ncbi:PF11175 domain protein [Leptospira meyeri serovar Semaranga str. Veldrot Semarang 173]|nr:PF11175 domain protein [Leptospira meyeri serovar Semaranga str. Veldrot Semarang 173]